MLYIGSNASNEYFSGSIDEVRVSNIARSADWIATEYNNQSSPSTFYTISTVTFSYSVTRSDSFSLVDRTVLLIAGKALLDAFLLNELMKRSLARRLLEAISPSDTITKSGHKPITSVFSPSDSISRSPAKSFNDSFSLLDMLTRFAARRVADAFSLAERFGKAASKVIVNTISPADSINKGTAANFTDSVFPVDSITRAITRALKLNDAFALIDLLMRKPAKAVKDAFSLAEHFVRNFLNGLMFHDAFSIADTLVRRTKRLLGDVFSLNEQARRGIARRFANAIAPSDSIHRTPTKQFREGFSLSEVFQPLLHLPGTVRTFLAQLWKRLFTASTYDSMICDILKPAGSNETFEVDWTELLNGLDTITASTWAIAEGDGEMTTSSSTFTTTTASVMLSGGTAGVYYLVNNKVTLVSGQTRVQGLLVRVTE